MKAKRFKKLMAVALAAVLATTTLAPAGVQTVQAEETVTENPFAKNVALGKKVTVNVLEGYGSNEENAGQIVDGTIEGQSWEPGNHSNPEIIIDLEEKYILDKVSVYWRDTYLANSYEVYVSKDAAKWTLVGEEEDMPGTPNDRGIAETRQMDYTFSPQKAQYIKVVCTKSETGAYCLREIEAYSIGTLEEGKESKYALNKETISASSVRYEGEDRGPVNNINDGNVNTVWQSGGEAGNYEYCCIDLRETQLINQIVVNWVLNSPASEYTIDVATSDEAVSENNIAKVGEGGWTTIVSQNAIPGDLDETTAEMISNLETAVEARYVKLTGKVKENWAYGICVRELEANYVKESISANAIYISKENVLLEEVGDTTTLYSQVLPANAVDYEVTWDSTNKEVATVDNQGMVKAIGNGTTTITATVNDTYTASCEVRVAEMLETPSANAVKADTDAIQIVWNEIAHADTYEIYRTSKEETDILLDTVTETTYTDDALKAGETYTYKVKALDSKDIYVASELSAATEGITIPLSVTSVSLNSVKEELVVGEAEKTLSVAISPDNATIQSVVWETSAPNIVEVIPSADKKNANIRPIAAGSAEITVRVTDEQGNVESAVCSVFVKAKLAAPTVKAEKTGAYEIKVTWNEVEGAVSYDVYRLVGKDGVFTLCKEAVERTEYVDKISSETAGNTYRYQVVAKAAINDEKYLDGVMSAASNKIQIGEVSPFGRNVAEGAKVTASSVEGSREAKYAVDGDTTSAVNWWESTKENEQDFLLVELDDVYKIDRIKVYWSNVVPANVYSILVGDTEETLEPVKKYTTAETDVTNFTTDCIFEEAKEVRYVKVVMDEPVNYNCFGIFEIEVYTQGTIESEDGTLKDIIISRENIQLEKGESIDLFAQKLPMNATEEVEWTTSNEKIATVNEGVVTALATGEATITAKAGTVSANCTVTVTQQLDAPTSVSANLLNDMSQVEVTWDVVDKADSYKIFRKEGNNNYVLLNTISENTYVDATVEEGGAYVYTVKAISGDKCFTESDYSLATAKIVIPVRVDGVSLDETETTIFVGETVELTATVTPKDATNQEVTWSSENKEIAKVENGVVTGVLAGTTKITVTTTDGQKRAECIITVVQKLETPVVKAVKAEDDSMIILTWEKIENAKDYTIYRSVDGKVAETIDTIKQKAVTELIYEDKDVKEGSMYIYTIIANPASEYYVESDESEATTKITIPVHAESVSLNHVQAELSVGEEIVLIATVKPDNAVNKTVSWNSSEPSVATVTDGKVIALAAGKTIITVTTEDGRKTDECEITVKAVAAKPEQKPNENVGQNENKKPSTPQTPQISQAPHTHTWSEVQIIKDATTTETGLKGQKCTKCGEVNTATKEVMPVYTVKLNATSAPLQVKKSTKVIKATVVDGDKIVKWSSSNAKIATVNSKGVIKAKKKTGTVEITATSAKGAKATIKIKVQKGKVKTKKVAVINVKNNKLQLRKGEKFSLDVSITPITSPEKIKYTTSNKKIVTVTNKGVLKARNKGKVKITVKSGNKKKVIQVTVK